MEPGYQARRLRASSEGRAKFFLLEKSTIHLTHLSGKNDEKASRSHRPLNRTGSSKQYYKKKPGGAELFLRARRQKTEFFFVSA